MDARDEVVYTLTDDAATDRMTESHQPRVVTRRLALCCHFAFRMAALVVYLGCAWLTSAFIGPFVVILLCLSIDFWIVKNVSGRLLVGLRWWNRVDRDGASVWVFEARPRQAAGDKNGYVGRRAAEADQRATYEARLFWMGLVMAPVVWFILLCTALFSSLRWALVALLACGMLGANLYGYIRCRFGNHASFGTGGGGLNSLLKRQLFSNLWSGVFTPSPTASFGGGAVPANDGSSTAGQTTVNGPVVK